MLLVGGEFPAAETAAPARGTSRAATGHAVRSPRGHTGRHPGRHPAGRGLAVELRHGDSAALQGLMEVRRLLEPVATALATITFHDQSDTLRHCSGSK
ncbi:hypothetical protein GCM10010251_61740 [Streptomyces aurantiogriseus]|uniref:Uncharacterized protein n=1 Tax=Streptomyces aurantiogriseus TaxID=66870 RepID=A0A918KWF2_9ACTN|nr:hypothetical protein GCM10010251_61740 [Streptomyces aurantiogriseus]